MFFFFLLACVAKTHAQNLLANGSFEDRNICIEFRSACAPEAWFRVPLSPVTSSTGTAGFFKGNRYESLVMEILQSPFVSRSFIYTRLLCKLEPGRVYQFRSSFRTVDNEFDHVDVLMLPFEPNRNKQHLSLMKQKFTITGKHKLADRPNDWADYLFEFTATGKELYLAIGNFSKDTLPVRKQLRGQDPPVVYDIDNVSLLPADSTIGACPEWKANTTRLYQNNSRHTINNYLDDEEEIKMADLEESPKPTPVMPVVAIVNDTLVIPDVLFRFNSSELNPQFTGRLDTLINKIRTRSFKSMEVTGHTDSLGTNALNQSLSLHRAETVKNYLAAKLSYAPASITAIGKAASIPIATNKTATGRQKNRRVEIVLVR